MSGLKGILSLLLLCFSLPSLGEVINLSGANRQLPLTPLYQTLPSPKSETLKLPSHTLRNEDGPPWQTLSLHNQSRNTLSIILTQPLWQTTPKLFLHRADSTDLAELRMTQAPFPMPAHQVSIKLEAGEKVSLYLQGKHLPQTLWKTSWWISWTQQQSTVMLLLLGSELALLLVLGLLSLVPKTRTPLTAIALLSLFALLPFLYPQTSINTLLPLWPLSLALTQALVNYRLYYSAALIPSLRTTLIIITFFSITVSVAALILPIISQTQILSVLLAGCFISSLALLQLFMKRQESEWLLLAGLQLLTAIIANALSSGPELESITFITSLPLLMATLVLLYLCQKLNQPTSHKLNAKATLKEIVRHKEAYLLEERYELLLNQQRELELQHKLLQEKNAIDFLTGLRNRQFFDERFKSELSRSARESTPISLLLIDIDHFKTVNDRYGHRVGDEVLKVVAKRLYYVLKRPSDAVCRYGGEEFAIILPNTHGQGALHIAELILNTIRAKPVITAQGNIHCAVSIGIASTVHSFHQPESRLIEDADKALYRAKENGRGRIELAPAKPYVVKDERSMQA